MRWKRDRGDTDNLFLEWIKSSELPLQGKGKRKVLLSSGWGKPTLFLLNILYLPLLTVSYVMTHYIFHFRIWNNSKTKERLKSNLSHILGSRKDILIKVFSKFARSLRGKTERSFRENGSLSMGSVFFLLKKIHSALESKKASIRTSIFLLPETSKFPVLGCFPVLMGGRARFQWQSQFPQGSISYIFYFVVWPSPKLPFAEGFASEWHFTFRQFQSSWYFTLKIISPLFYWS